MLYRLLAAILLLGVCAGAQSRLLKDLHPGSADSFVLDYSPQGLVHPVAYLNGNAYFLTKDCQLWSTDGTTANTVLIHDFGASGSGLCGSLARVNNSLMINIYGGGVWTSTGAIENATPFTSPNLHDVSTVQPWEGRPGWLVITSLNGSNYETWASDGSSAGTFLLATLGASSTFPRYAFLNEQRLAITGSNGLWLASTPTVPATAIGSGISSIKGMLTDGNNVFISDGVTLRYSNMTSLGTHIVSGYTTGSSTLTLAGMKGSSAFFTIGDVMWVSNAGSPASVLTTAGAVIAIADAHAIGNDVVFPGNENDGYHVWRSDGTMAGTVELTTAPDIANPFGLVVDAPNYFYYAKQTSGLNVSRVDTSLNVVSNFGQRPLSAAPAVRLGSAYATIGSQYLNTFNADGGMSYTNTNQPSAGNPIAMFFGGAVAYYASSETTTGLEPYAIDLAGTTTPICSAPNQAIPDNGSAANDIIRVPQHLPITNLRLDLRVSHTAVGDLTGYLNHIDSAGHVRSTYLFHRPAGCVSNDLDVVFDDRVPHTLDQTVCATDTHAQAYPAGLEVQADQAMASYVGDDLNGTWVLQVIDSATGNTGGITQWCLETTGTSDVIFKNGFEAPIPTS